MIFLFPLNVVLPIVVLVVVEPLFGGVAVVVAADVLNTAPLLCAAFREVLSSAGCTFVSTAFSDDSKSLLIPRMMSQTDRWAEAVEKQAKMQQGRRRAVDGILIVKIFAAASIFHLLDPALPENPSTAQASNQEVLNVALAVGGGK